MKHLASISMDPAAIKYFQEAKVPVAETLAIDFSFGILEIVQKTFFSGRWREENERVLHGLFEESSRLKVTMEKREQLREQTISFAFIFRSYAILFLLYLVFHFQTGGIDNYLVLMATILVLFSFLTDPYFLKLYKKGKERTGRVLKFKGKNAKPGVCIRSHR
jgi:ABC-type xylose transport system permease subunit